MNMNTPSTLILYDWDININSFRMVCNQYRSARDIDVRGNILLDLIDYWREVKKEIEKL